MQLGKAGGVKILTAIAEAHTEPREKRRVVVPTMGALHRAHGELIRVAREHASRGGEVVVSVFVNPLQFEPGSDYERYPRPERADEDFCRSAGVDLLFRPSVGRCMPMIVQCSSTNSLFRKYWRANRAPDIFAEFVRSSPSCSMFLRLT